MTPSEITSLLDRHLSDWLGQDAGSLTLRSRMADAIREAVKQRDKLWADGNVAIRAERDTARTQLAQMTQCRDDAVAAAHLMHEEGK